MKLIKNGKYPETGKGTALALGYFDGIHEGHQAVIRAAAEYGETHGLDTAVFTFSLNGENSTKGKRILSAEYKHRVLAQLKVDYCFEPPFKEFCKKTPEEFFYYMLVGDYSAKAIFCGEDFYFGAKRSGDTNLLKKLAGESGIKLFIIPTAEWKGEAISSSRIRAALVEGKIEDANAMLGRPYEIDFPVKHGAGLGRELGFPTLNQIFPEDMQIPKYGVYITKSLVGGNEMPSATGFGFRPTVGGETATCETFVPNFSGELYGEHIPVRFFKRIDDIRKFDSYEELTQAVKGWAKQALDYFN